MDDNEEIKDTRFAKVAYYVAYIPVIGILLFILFGFIALQRITYRGRSGFTLLGKGAKNLLLVNLLYFSLWYYTKNYHLFGPRKYNYEKKFDNTFEKETEYYPNGGVYIERIRNHDILVVLAYDESGQISMRRCYKEIDNQSYVVVGYWEAVGEFGRRYIMHGKVFAYHKNGKLSWLADFQNGWPKGPNRYYDENGNLEKEEVYAAGRVVSETKCVDGKPVPSPTQ